MNAPLTTEQCHWQHIDTAPKDGQTFLAFGDCGVDMWYWDDDRYAKKPKPYFKRVRQMSVIHDRATGLSHWRPLPEPPQ